MSNWRNTTIGALGRVVTGKTPKTSHPEYYGGDIPFITPSDMEQRYALDVSRKLSDAGARSVKNCILPAYSVAVSCIGSDMGKSVMTDRPSVTNQQLNAIIVNNENDPHFVYYLTSSMRAIFKLNAQGSTALPILNKGHFANIKVQVPDLPTQKMLAGALSALDSKIEHNNELIRMLEEQAQLLYDYWFMQFDFPDENGRPYRSSGGKMVWSEELKREIPEGWSAASLQSIQGNIITGKTPSTAEASYFGGDVPFITIDDIRGHRFVFRTSRTLTEDGAATQSKKYLPENSLCCSCIGTVGVIGFTGRKSQTNQQINSIVFSDKRYAEFIYFSLLLHFKYADAKMGNVIKNMNKEEFASISLLHPPMALIEKFHKATGEAFARIKNAEHNTVSLQEQRDFLLPLLMSGQVTVAD